MLLLVVLLLLLSLLLWLLLLLLLYIKTICINNRTFIGKFIYLKPTNTFKFILSVLIQDVWCWSCLIKELHGTFIEHDFGNICNWLSLLVLNTCNTNYMIYILLIYNAETSHLPFVQWYISTSGRHTRQVSVTDVVFSIVHWPSIRQDDSLKIETLQRIK